MGYVHDTQVSYYIPPTLFHAVTGTFTDAAGDVAGTICMNRAAANETSVITIPIVVPSSSTALHGCQLKSIEVDYENKGAEQDSLTWTLNKVTRGINGAVAVVAATTKTDAIAAADSHSVDQHKQVITITTPAWIDNDEYYLLEISIVAGAGGGTCKLLAAVAKTDAIAAADSHSVDQHKQVITLSTPAWIDNDEYYLLEISLVAGAGGGTEKFLGAVANFTLRL